MKDTDRDLQLLEEGLPPEGYQTDKITFDEGSNNLKMVQSKKSKKNYTPVFLYTFNTKKKLGSNSGKFKKPLRNL